MPRNTDRRTNMNPQEFDSEDLSVFHRYFDLRLFLSLAAALIPVVVPLFIWGISVESRLVLQQEQLRLMTADQMRQDSAMKEVALSFREDIREVARKLDRLIENGGYLQKK